VIGAAPVPSNTVPPRMTKSKSGITTRLSILAGIQSILGSMLIRMSPVKPPRTRPTRGEVRDRILDAAAKVFAAEGFAGATIDAIGQAAGFTKGAVYSNFGSKDELFLALLDPDLRERLIARRRAAAADQAHNIAESTATVPSGPRLAELAQLVVTINL